MLGLRKTSKFQVYDCITIRCLYFKKETHPHVRWLGAVVTADENEGGGASSQWSRSDAWDGCDWTGNDEAELVDHLTTCIYVPVPCPNTGNCSEHSTGGEQHKKFLSKQLHRPKPGVWEHPRSCGACRMTCPFSIPRKDLQKHLRFCAYRLVPCEFCGIQSPALFLDSHSQNACAISEKLGQTCSYCGDDTLTGGTLQTHIDAVCPDSPIKCPVDHGPFYFQCAVQGLTRRTLANHMAAYAEEHDRIRAKWEEANRE
jgi:TRAF-type zinc finger